MSAVKSLDERLSFMKIDAEARRRLSASKAVVTKALPDALDNFYGQVRSTPQTRALFRDESHIASAKSLQLAHWDRLADGAIDATYVEAVNRIGHVHARIGLEPRWYIGGYALLLEHLAGALVEAHWPKSRFGRQPPPTALVAELGAVIKATLLDIDYSVASYLEAGEQARLATEAEVLRRERQSVVDRVGEAMAALSSGDLMVQMSADIPPDYAQLREDFNTAIKTLRETMAAISEATGALREGAEEIASSSDDLSRRTERQAASLEETAAALDEITATVRQSADGARDASAKVAQTRAGARRSGEVVREAIRAMGEIEQSSGQITQIIGVIDEIAFQTNLLALNAGVEAARAGDAGKGFAVVAQEVRALAQRSAEAAKEIKGLISASGAHVGAGVKLVGETGDALGSIVEQVDDIDALISRIAASSQEQSTGLAEINAAVNQMDQIIQQNAAMVEQATAATTGLQQKTLELEKRVGRFDIGAGSAARKPVLRPASRDDAPGPNPVAEARERVAKFASAGGGAPRAAAAAATATADWEEF